MKRGVSSVIVTLLIILVSLASLFIIWSAIEPSLDDTRDDLSRSSCLTLVVNPVSCFTNETFTAVTVERGVGEGSFNQLRFVFTLEEGTRASTFDAPSFDQLERRRFGLASSLVPGLRSVDIAPILADGTVCPLTKTSILCSSDSESLRAFACSDGLDNDRDGHIDVGDDLGCTDAFDDDESDDLSPRYACSDGLDNDLDTFTDFPADRGCENATDTDEQDIIIIGRDHNFQFSFNDQGLLVELNWTNDNGSSWRRVIWDEVARGVSGAESFYSHSRTKNIGPDRSWSYVYGPDWPMPDTLTREPHNTITYQKLSQTNRSVLVEARTSRLRVHDSFWFVGDDVHVNVTITNTDSQALRARIPLYFGGLYLNDGSRHRLFGREGGVIESFTSNNGGDRSSCVYTDGIRCFSPVSSVWDGQTALGLQHTSESYLPTGVEMDERIEGTGTDKIEVLKPIMSVWLAPGTSQTLSFVLRVGPAASGWQYTLEPYKQWFYTTYGGPTPSYCPAPAYAMFFARNAGTGAWNPNPPYNQTTERFNLGASIEDIYIDRFGTISDMNSIGLQMFGVWGSTIHPTHLLQDPEAYIEFNFMAPPTFFDPNLDVGPDRSKLTTLANRFSSADKKIFWYIRECVDIPGASIDYNSGIITRSTTNGLDEAHFDLRIPSNYELSRDRIEHFFSYGLQGVYLDAPRCVGVDPLLQDIVSNYGSDHYVMIEGGVDRRALYAPQLQILEDEGMNDHSHLFLWLLPNATFFEAEREIPNLDLVLSRGYQPVVSNGVRELSDVIQIPGNDICDRTNSWMRQAYENQMDRWISYGQAMGCPAPVEPINCN